MCRKESFKNTSKMIGDSPTKNVTSVTKRLKIHQKAKKILIHHFGDASGSAHFQFFFMLWLY